MAEDKEKQSGGEPMTTNSFTKGMIKDFNDTFVGEGLYIHARNAVDSSHDGQLGVIGNESSNLFCVQFPYTVIGYVRITGGRWAIFTTNDVNSEIGIFDEFACTYTTIVNDPCLNFKKSNLITGVSRERFDCKVLLYWDDGLNPTRVLNIDDVPWKQNCRIINGCKVCTDILINNKKVLDCEEIRLARLIKQPCIILQKGRSAGTLPTGSYQVCLAYSVNQIKVTDYLGLSEVQSLFTHEGGAGESSLEVKITQIDTTFDEFELVVVSNVNSQTVAKSMGYYSTSQGTININTISPELIDIPLNNLIFRSEPVEKSDALYAVNDYLLRVGPYTKFKFNYQLQANNIRAKWVSVKYPSDYYTKGGNNTGYMRDEVYSFFIRWVYNTGDKSDSYHIPGRPPFSTELSSDGSGDAFEVANGENVKEWQVQNTATLTNTSSYTLPDGGVVLASGDMAYWESTEYYPADRPDIWGTLCGKAIRHHKFPDETVDPLLNIMTDNGASINLLGVRFENITHPVDLNGNPIQSIVGYEILRGSREGQKSIIAKGIINNMREYTIPGNTAVKGLFQNYPYNDLRPDPYLTTKEQIGGETGKANPSSPFMTTYKKDTFSFHSPDTTFNRPYLALNEVKVYGEMTGTSTGYFTTPFKHPKFKVLTTFSTVIGSIVGVLTSSLVFSKGIDIGSTEDYPIGIKIGPLPPFPQKPDPVTGSSSTIINIQNTISYYSNLATWIGEVGTMALIFGQLASLQREKLLSIMLILIPKRQYAAQFNSHGFYNNFTSSTEGNRRRKVKESIYVDPVVQGFNIQYQINNVYRSRYVAFQLEREINDPTTKDFSRYTLSRSNTKKLDVNEETPISSHYAALKVGIAGQYGQIESIKQMPVSICTSYTTPEKNKRFSSDVFFNGDIYINRFTEKNTMFFFTDWLIDLPDEFQYDYTLYQNLPYPRYWITSTEYQGSTILQQAERWRSLDLRKSAGIYVKQGYFYLFNSGVRDFFVESEVNVALRDWEDEVEKRHYDPYKYTDLNAMFRSDYIRAGNYYKYDYALSISKMYSNFVSWGSVLPRSYDPLVADKCYTYLPNRVIYSLPQQDESLSDNWRLFLSNNYYDFDSRLTSVKQVNKTGALFMMNTRSPVQFMGVDQLETDQGLKVTIGDGGLFNQALQNIVNADSPYEYGSCQNKYAVVGTVYGIFWVSQNQGKIFQYAGQLADITSNSMKWWFAKYLPSQLLEKFPSYKHSDNPVIGVGVSMIYDNTYELIYITKIDYKPKIDLTYEEETGRFYSQENGIKTYRDFRDQMAFENASWTISYDPKSKAWISFHDWVPSFLIPGKNHFMTINGDSLWKHNVRCDSYCNYYGVDYPWEVEFVSSTGQTVTTLRNLEYMLEAYKYYNDCKDRFHVLDRNFTEAIVYNSEQISGTLQLNIKPKNNPLALLNYPAVRTDYIDIIYSKEENKYRFNQFWDITKDRSEFTPANAPAPTNIPMFITEANGYKFKINPDYVDYNKDPLQRKKFRHYVNRVFLRNTKNNNIKFLFKLSNQKIQQSFR